MQGRDNGAGKGGWSSSSSSAAAETSSSSADDRSRPAQNGDATRALEGEIQASRLEQSSTVGDAPSAKSAASGTRQVAPRSNGAAAGVGRGGANPNGEDVARLKGRSSDKEFREALGKGLAACRRNLVT